MKKIIQLFLLLFCNPLQSAQKTSGIITVPVVDVRAYPDFKRCRKNKKHDLNQTSQLLWGEEVIIATENKGWSNVAIPAQKIFCKKNKKIEDCSGWIPTDSFIKTDEIKKANAFIKKPIAHLYSSKDDALKPTLNLYLGTPLRGYQVDEKWWKIETPKKEELWIKKADLFSIKKKKTLKDKQKLRASLLNTGLSFLHAPYCWGGRSTHQSLGSNGAHFSSVDCSALTQLIYQAHGITIPRNSTGQYAQSKHLNGNQLSPGDLLFISHDASAEHIFHVMLYLGNNQLLEAVAEHNKVRIVSVADKLKTSINLIKNGKRYKKYYIFCGSFLS